MFSFLFIGFVSGLCVILERDKRRFYLSETEKEGTWRRWGGFGGGSVMMEASLGKLVCVTLCLYRGLMTIMAWNPFLNSLLSSSLLLPRFLCMLAFCMMPPFLWCPVMSTPLRACLECAFCLFSELPWTCFWTICLWVYAFSSLSGLAIAFLMLA